MNFFFLRFPDWVYFLFNTSKNHIWQVRTSRILKIYISIHMYGCFAQMYVYEPSVCLMSTDQKRGSDCLQVGLYMVVSMWELGTKPKFSGREASAFNCWTIFSNPLVLLLSFLKIEFHYVALTGKQVPKEMSLVWN